jgi:hypothetical protein
LQMKVSWTEALGVVAAGNAGAASTGPVAMSAPSPSAVRQIAEIAR